MMWAKTQFIGCAGARMFDGFLVTCYYHPSGNRIGKPVFKRGKDENDACTECSELRSSCSRTLTGLCGLDDEYILRSKAEIKTDIKFILFFVNLLTLYKSCF